MPEPTSHKPPNHGTATLEERVKTFAAQIGQGYEITLPDLQMYLEFEGPEFAALFEQNLQD